MASTVIIGTGVIGVSTAYYLSEHQPPETIHLVETASELFASASGFAGGFLARDWFRSDVGELAALSFDQHRALAAKYDGRTHWGYAPSTSLSYSLPDEEKSTRDRKRGEDWLRQGTSRSTAAPPAEAADVGASSLASNGPVWLSRRAGDYVEVLADDGSTAQVDPLKFCQFLLKICLDRGVQLYQPARVVSIGTDVEGELATVSVETGVEGSGTTLSQTTLPCTRLIIAAGAWSPRVLRSLFLGPDKEQPGNTTGSTTKTDSKSLPVTNYAGHSLVVRVPQSTAIASAASCHAIFAAGSTLDYCPEIFSRVGGTLYLAGLNSSNIPLPHQATDSLPQPEKLADLLAKCKEVLGISPSLSEEDAGIETVRKGLCHRPATPWGLPLVLRLPDERLQSAGDARPSIKTKPGPAGGVFVAAGHGPWGISMAPGTGMALAELAQGRPLSADLTGLGFH